MGGGKQDTLRLSPEAPYLAARARSLCRHHSCTIHGHVGSVWSASSHDSDYYVDG